MAETTLAETAVVMPALREGSCPPSSSSTRRSSTTPRSGSSLFSRDDIVRLAAVQGDTWDPSLGLLFAGMLDCSRKPTAGVTWDPSIVDMKSKRFFYVNGLPDEAADATDATGFGGPLNAPTGTITVNARVQATGKTVSTATVLVRAGSASYSYLAPTP